LPDILARPMSSKPLSTGLTKLHLPASLIMDAHTWVASQDFSILLKQFTSWTTASMVANLIVGIFSMNVQLPMPGKNSNWPFYLINVLAIASGVGIFWISKMVSEFFCALLCRSYSVRAKP